MNWEYADGIGAILNIPYEAVEACVMRDDFPKEGYRRTMYPTNGLENDGLYYWGEFEYNEEEVLEIKPSIFLDYWKKLCEYSRSLPQKTENKGYYSQTEYNSLLFGWHALRHDAKEIPLRDRDFCLGKNSSGQCAVFVKKQIVHTLLIKFFEKLPDTSKEEIRHQLANKCLVVINDKIRLGQIPFELARLNSWLFKSRLTEVKLCVRESALKRELPLWVIAVPA